MVDVGCHERIVDRGRQLARWPIVPDDLLKGLELQGQRGHVVRVRLNRRFQRKTVDATLANRLKGGDEVELFFLFLVTGLEELHAAVAMDAPTTTRAAVVRVEGHRGGLAKMTGATDVSILQHHGHRWTEVRRGSIGV